MWKALCDHYKIPQREKFDPVHAAQHALQRWVNNSFEKNGLYALDQEVIEIILAHSRTLRAYDRRNFSSARVPAFGDDQRPHSSFSSTNKAYHHTQQPPASPNMGKSTFADVLEDPLHPGILFQQDLLPFDQEFLGFEDRNITMTVSKEKEGYRYHYWQKPLRWCQLWVDENNTDNLCHYSCLSNEKPQYGIFPLCKRVWAKSSKNAETTEVYGVWVYGGRHFIKQNIVFWAVVLLLGTLGILETGFYLRTLRFSTSK